MTAGYKMALGHDVAELDLEVIEPQPHTTGVQYARRTYGADGTVYEENPYVELEWNMIESVAAYQTLLQQFGLGSGGATSVAITLKVPDFTFAFNRFNGTAIRPEHGREVQHENYFIRNLVIVVRIEGNAA